MHQFIFVLLALASLSACVVLDPHSVAVEHSHVSHPSVNRMGTEDTFDMLGVSVEYHWAQRGYTRINCGIKIDSPGFIGPDDVCTIANGFLIRGQHE